MTTNAKSSLTIHDYAVTLGTTLKDIRAKRADAKATYREALKKLATDFKATIAGLDAEKTAAWSTYKAEAKRLRKNAKERARRKAAKKAATKKVVAIAAA